MDQRHQRTADRSGLRTTINREWGLLSEALNWAKGELEWLLPNPVMGRLLREPEGRLRWLSREQAKRLVDAAREQPRAGYLADFLELALNIGMRHGEMLGLEWSDRGVTSPCRYSSHDALCA